MIKYTGLVYIITLYLLKADLNLYFTIEIINLKEKT